MARLERELIAAYEENDDATRIARADRAAWIARLGEPQEGWIFFGDYGVIAPWIELRRTFIEGSFVATILVGQAFLENLLAALLESDEIDVGRKGLADVLNVTRDRGWLTEPEYKLLDRLRRMRNPYAHYRHLGHPETLIQRAIKAGRSPETIMEDDARAVVEALYHLVNRRPFALGAIGIPEEDEPLIHPDQINLSL